MPSYSKQNQTGRGGWVEVDGVSKFHGAESDLQKQCEEYLSYFPKIKFIRIPDAVYNVIFASLRLPEWLKKLIASYLKGLPDLTLLRECGSGTKARCVELKVKGRKPNKGQREFAAVIKLYVIETLEDFQKLVEDFNKD